MTFSSGIALRSVVVPGEIMQVIVTSKDYTGAMCTLRHNSNDEPVHNMDVILDFRGDAHRVHGGRAPHKRGAEGMVHTDKGEFYVGNFKLCWVQS